MTLHYLARNLGVIAQLDLELRALIQQKQKPTLIRLSNKASVQYVLEKRITRISDGPKYHLLQGYCLVEIRYNDPGVTWFKIESQ